MNENDYPRLDDEGLLYLTQLLKDKFGIMLVAGTPDMQGATSSANGERGFVPKPNSGQQNNFLRGDGTWSPAENAIESISVNGTSQTIDQNKNVNISVPVRVSDLSNDSDFQTGQQVAQAINVAVASTYKPGGSCAFENLPALIAENSGFVYNITNDFTTTANFVEGSGKHFEANTDVGIIQRVEGGQTVYKYNVLAGFVDLSGYVPRSEMTTITNEEIADIVDEVWP